MLLTGLPSGAVAQDTAEYMLGNAVATVVFFESNGSIDLNLENWNPLVRDQSGNVVLDSEGRTISASGPNLIEAAKSKVIEGLQWWEDALDSFYLTNYDDVDPIHSLNFTLDFEYAHNPISTGYEPISRVSQDYTRWVADFLSATGYLATGSIDTDIRTFNNAQRVKYDADWAFTIFVVNDDIDSDGLFAPGSQFLQAFSFSGGRFLVAPAGRPASTFAHETGHIFYARDEYAGSGASYTDRRGYYNSQNWNAWDNPTPGWMQQDSLMNSGASLQRAYANHTSSTSSLAMIGWQDSDGDGVFDVLDIPLSLAGSGYYDSATERYRFVGSSSVGTLPNLNSSGRGNDITINEVSQLVYSLDDGATWTVWSDYDAYEVAIDVSIPLPLGDEILIRTQSVDPLTHQIVTTSEVFSGNTTSASSVAPSGIEGFVWYDENENSQWDLDERGISGWTIQLVDDAGIARETAQYLDPDSYQHQEVLNTALNEVTLTATGYDVKDGRVGALTSSRTSTGTRVFGLVRYGFTDNWVTQWTDDSRNLRIDFETPTTFVSIDALAAGTAAYGRLEIYDVAGNLIDRYTTQLLAGNAAETMALGTPTAQISYAIVRAANETSILLDNLQVGPSATTTTNQFGGYAFPYLPAGPFRVHGIATADWNPFTPASGIVEVIINAEGDMQWLPGTARPSDIGAQPSPTASPWKNLLSPLDVSDDGRISPIDALLVIDELNRNGSGALSAPNDDFAPPPYLDVNGDKRVSPIDVLLVIDWLNGNSSASSSSTSGGGDGESGGSDGGGSEGEAWNGIWETANPDASTDIRLASFVQLRDTVATPDWGRVSLLGKDAVNASTEQVSTLTRHGRQEDSSATSSTALLAGLELWLPSALEESAQVGSPERLSNALAWQLPSIDRWLPRQVPTQFSDRSDLATVGATSLDLSGHTSTRRGDAPFAPGSPSYSLVSDELLTLLAREIRGRKSGVIPPEDVPRDVALPAADVDSA